MARLTGKQRLNIVWIGAWTLLLIPFATEFLLKGKIEGASIFLTGATSIDVAIAFLPSMISRNGYKLGISFGWLLFMFGVCLVGSTSGTSLKSGHWISDFIGSFLGLGVLPIVFIRSAFWVYEGFKQDSRT